MSISGLVVGTLVFGAGVVAGAVGYRENKTVQETTDVVVDITLDKINEAKERIAKHHAAVLAAKK